MKILLLCSMGISTHLYEEKVLQSARERGMELEIESLAAELASEYQGDADIILLAPHIRFNRQKIQNLFPHRIVDVIPLEVFRNLDPNPVFEMINKYFPQHDSLRH